MHIQNFDPYDFKKKKINGVNVYYKNLPWAPCVHIYFTIAVGAFSDPVGKEGTAHFLEHMIGNGSPMVQDKKAVKEFSRLYMLNSRNAYTSYYQTVYHGKCLPEHFSKVLPTVKDYVFHPFLRPEDAEHERKVITQEAWGRFKNDKYLKYIQNYVHNIYNGHQKNRINSPLGWPKTIAKITQKDLKDFHTKHYNKENLSIFLVGNISESDLSIVEKVIKDIPKGMKTVIDTGLADKPKKLRLKIKSVDIGDPQEQLEFTITRVLNKNVFTEDWTKLLTRQLMYDILYERLRIEHSLCYGVSLSFQNYKDYAEIGISVNTSEDKVALVEKEIWAVIKEILTNKWKERFEIIKKLTLDQIRSSEQSSGHIIDDASTDIITYGQIETQKQKLNKITKVTYRDVQKTIKEIFDPKFTFTEIILPSKKQK